MIDIRSHLQGTVVDVAVRPGQVVRANEVLFLIESMKMHHDVVAPDAGVVEELLVDVGRAVMPGDALARLGAVADHDDVGDGADVAGGPDVAAAPPAPGPTWPR